ncbi:MAG: helix-turn-helix transcriptional regulator [Treponema sp.]|nr:helix-turn-helix transcriptional regulator [Treponema sp.]
MSEIITILGNNIKRIRKEKEWTQEYLAEKAGISVPFMTQIELARKQPSLEVIEKIANALDVPYDVLFINDVSPEGKSKNTQLYEQFLKKIEFDIHNFINNR